jgi:hypothetical protein
MPPMAVIPLAAVSLLITNLRTSVNMGWKIIINVNIGRIESSRHVSSGRAADEKRTERRKLLHKIYA